MTEKIMCTHYPIIIKINGKTYISPISHRGIGNSAPFHVPEQWMEVSNDTTIPDFEFTVDTEDNRCHCDDDDDDGDGDMSQHNPNDLESKDVVDEQSYLSSDGVTNYWVALKNDGTVSCTCPGFHYRTSCKHVYKYMDDYPFVVAVHKNKSMK